MNGIQQPEAGAQLSPPTPEELARLFRLARDTDPSLATFVLLAASTGARRGELIALRWRDVDFDRCLLRIERGIVLADGRLVEQGTKKTHQSRRVTRDPDTVVALSDHRRESKTNASACGTALTSDSFVFSNAADGSSPWRLDSTNRGFRVLCSRAGVRGVRLHDLRHHVATRLLASGIDVGTVAGRLGHRNPQPPSMCTPTSPRRGTTRPPPPSAKSFETPCARQRIETDRLRRRRRVAIFD